MSDFYSVQDGKLIRSLGIAQGMMPIAQAQNCLTPSLVKTLHRSFKEWEAVPLSPGPILPQSVFIDTTGALAIHAPTEAGLLPKMSNTGLAQDLAAWLVLLDKWVSTDVVVGSAAEVWSVDALAQALPFITPAFLPRGMMKWPPANSERVARAVARVAAASPAAPAPVEETAERRP